MLAIRNTVSFQLKSSLLDKEGGYIIFTQEPFTLVTIYAPNSHQLHFFRRAFKLVSSVKYGHLLMCGDFNRLTPNWILIPLLKVESNH